MNHNRIKWNYKYSDKKGYIFEPISFIKDNIGLLKKGRLLDIACGYGKNSIFLAESGFEVTAFDISDKALKIFNNEIKNRNIKLSIFQGAVENISNILKPNYFDTILVSRFKPDNILLDSIVTLLKNNGVFILTSFNKKQNSVHPQPIPDKCYLDKKELINSNSNLVNIKYEEFEFNNGFYNGYLFNKNFIK